MAPVDSLPPSLDVQDSEAPVFVEALDPLDRTTLHVSVKRVRPIRLERHLAAVLRLPVWPSGGREPIAAIDQDSLAHAIRVSSDESHTVLRDSLRL